ncbi:unnamed protein product [Clonostachys rosea f. rosea IK726]|uniref:NmrA-like domain-containing protein n=2 Tax=Bionectria ochroleuca TaxID=29856 RepID=A0A0B7KAY8_BIOOC|nr:unnamed protein product [Clonostachys rosea f. rosea IK726]
MKVAIVGASGETGQSIAHALIQQPDTFEVTALCRPASEDKPEFQRLRNHGVKVVTLDLQAPHEELVAALVGQDTVICCIIPFVPETQIALANAAKEAKIKRFVPSAFGPACPPTGVLVLREIKEAVLNHIKKLYLPYTVIDVGWWYQTSLPRLPSGKLDYAIKFPNNKLVGDGNLKSALTDLRDVGKYVARIITDERTLNKSVFVYNEVLTQEDVYSNLEDLSGEKISRDYTNEEEILGNINAAQNRYDQDGSVPNLLGLSSTQYANSVWLRGDNLPESASYLGYLNGKELYPNLKHVPFADYVKELVAGKGKGVYVDRVFGFEKDTKMLDKQ